VLGTGVDGSGLGLAIVREIAEQHGCSVRIEAARPGARPPGARFVIVFPQTRALAVPHERLESPGFDSPGAPL
jgi:two-component system sensor histidine kinase TctE